MRLRGVLLRLALVGMVVWWAVSDGPLRAVGEWAVAVYVLWRAAPAIRPDIGRVLQLFSRHKASRFTGRGSEGRL